MQKLKVKQLDGVVSPSASDDWSSLTDQLATAASTSEKIDNAADGFELPGIESDDEIILKAIPLTH